MTQDRACEIFQIGNELVRNCYNNSPNYEIHTTDSLSDYVAIYFSSNGIYFPNDTDSFTRSILSENRYEWKRNRISRAGKHIYVRDVFKQWYIEGINHSINSIEKTAQFLLDQCRGKRIITVGSSAGGYAAILFGTLLNAEIIYSFSGQISLHHIIRRSSPGVNPLLFKHLENSDVAKYFDLSTMVQRSNCRIVYCYSGGVAEDQKHYERISKCENIIAFKFDSSIHGVPCFLFNLTDFLNMPDHELECLRDFYRGAAVNRLSFSCHVSGKANTLLGLIKLRAKRAMLKVVNLRRLV